LRHLPEIAFLPHFAFALVYALADKDEAAGTSMMPTQGR
jgi:hypothetical protein